MDLTGKTREGEVTGKRQNAKLQRTNARIPMHPLPFSWKSRREKTSRRRWRGESEKATDGEEDSSDEKNRRRGAKGERDKEVKKIMMP